MLSFLENLFKKEEEKEVKAIECFRCTKVNDCQFSEEYIKARIWKHVFDGGSCIAYDLDPNVDK